MYPRKKRQRYIPLLFAFVLVMAMIPVGYLFLNDSDRVVATYAGGSVTQAEFDKQFAFQRKLLMPSFEETDESKAAFLQEYITLHKLMIDAAKQEGVTIDESQLDEQVRTYKQEVTDLIYGGDPAQFNAQMQTYGINEEDIKELVRHDQYLRRYRELAVSQIQVTDEEARQYYDQHPAQFMTGTLAHILVPTEAQAQKVLERLASQEDFDKIAREVSTDPTAKNNGGKMENVQFGMFEPEFRDAAATLAVGQYSQPVQTGYGYHIIRVNQRDVQPYAEAAAEARQKALTERQDKAWDDLYMQHLREGNVQIEG